MFAELDLSFCSELLSRTSFASVEVPRSLRFRAGVRSLHVDQRMPQEAVEASPDRLHSWLDSFACFRRGPKGYLLVSVFKSSRVVR